MSLLSSLSLGLLKDKKPKSKAPGPTLGSDAFSTTASVRTAATMSLPRSVNGAHERQGLGALARSSPTVSQRPNYGNSSVGVVVAGPISGPTSSNTSTPSASSSALAKPAGVQPTSQPRQQVATSLQQSTPPAPPQRPVVAAVGGLLNAYSDSDEEEVGANDKESDPPHSGVPVSSATAFQDGVADVPSSAGRGPAVGCSGATSAAVATGRAPKTIQDKELPPPTAEELVDIDGEELLPSELKPISHMCGVRAWRWQTNDRRSSARGPFLGSATWTIESVKADEDPDFEDFAFLSEVADIEQELSDELGGQGDAHKYLPQGARPPTDIAPLLPESDPPHDPIDPAPPLIDQDGAPPHLLQVDKERPQVALSTVEQSTPQQLPSTVSPAPLPTKQSPCEDQVPLQNDLWETREISAGRRIAEQLRQADEPYRREEERRRDEHRRRVEEDRRRAEDKRRAKEIDDRRRAEEEDRRRAEERRRADRRRVKPREEDESRGRVKELDDERREKRWKDDEIRSGRDPKRRHGEATQPTETKMRRVEEERRHIEEVRKLASEARQRTTDLEQRKKRAQEQWINDCASGSDLPVSKRARSITFDFKSDAAVRERSISETAYNVAAHTSGGVGSKSSAPSADVPKTVQATTLLDLIRQPGHAITKATETVGIKPQSVREKLVVTASINPTPAAIVTSSVGWLPDGQKCGLCSKVVIEKGGVFCGRQRRDGSIAGCRAAICWKCMNKAPRETIGRIRTTKTEFASLGDHAWWMHERCMELTDLTEYSGAEGVGRKPTKTFAWE